MSVAIVSADAGKTAAGRGSKVVLCGGKAGIVQHEVAMQVGSNPCCMSASQSGQALPVLAPACADPCICAAIAALDAI
jgi:hypothetical protein